jgi:hypothetical protein
VLLFIDSSGYNDEMDDLLHKLLCLDAKKRISVEAAL